MKKRVLIIDDDITTLRIIEKYLSGAYDVRIENSGYRFIDKAGDYDVDLILLDMEMPVMNGLEVIERYEAMNIRKVPVVFLTAISNPEVVRAVLDAGAAGYIVKTSPKGEMLDKIEKIFQGHSSIEKKKELLLCAADIPLLTARRKTFEAAGYKVQLMNSVGSALEFIKAHPVDLVILGNVIPGAGAEELLPHFNKTGTNVLVMRDGMTDEELIKKAGSLLEQ